MIQSTIKRFQLLHFKLLAHDSQKRCLIVIGLSSLITRTSKICSSQQLKMMNCILFMKKCKLLDVLESSPKYALAIAIM